MKANEITALLQGKYLVYHAGERRASVLGRSQ
jgi:hypothetical protein